MTATFGRSRVGPGDEILISAMEHHSNIVPWQILCKQQGARLRIIPITDEGELDLDAYATLLSDRTRIVSVLLVSNVLGTVNPVEEVVRLAHRRGIPVLVDGAQAVGHRAVDVQTLVRQERFAGKSPVQPRIGCGLHRRARAPVTLRQAAVRTGGAGGYVPPPTRAARVRSPVGLSLGAETPEEVATSILGELLAIRRGFDGGFLSGSLGSLHRPEDQRALASS